METTKVSDRLRKEKGEWKNELKDRKENPNEIHE